MGLEENKIRRALLGKMRKRGVSAGDAAGLLRQRASEAAQGLNFQGAQEVGPDLEDWDWEPTANPGATSTNAKTQELRDLVHFRLQGRGTGRPGDRLVGALQKLEEDAAKGFIPKDPRSLRAYVQEVLSQPDAAMVSGPAMRKAAPRLFDAWWWGVSDNIKKTGAGAMGRLPGDHSLVEKAWKAAKGGNPAAANAYNKAFYYSGKGRNWEGGVQKEVARAKLFQALDAKHTPIDRFEGTLGDSVPGDRAWKDRLGDAGRTAKAVKDEEYAPVGRWVKGAKPPNALRLTEAARDMKQNLPLFYPKVGIKDVEQVHPQGPEIVGDLRKKGVIRLRPEVEFARSGAPRQTLKPGWEGVLKKAAARGDREADALVGMLKGMGGRKSTKGLEVFLGPQRMNQLMKIVKLLT